MVRPLSAYNYSGFLDNPHTLPISNEFPTVPLPTLDEPDVLPDVDVPASRDGEAMVAVEHRNIRVLSTYWHAGWETSRPGAFVRETVATRLYAAADSLPAPFGLAVLDAWRPLTLQSEIFDAAYADPTLPAGFVSPPSRNPATPPPHLTGGTVDVTLTWNQRPLTLGTEFDAFDDTARTAAFEHTPGLVRDLRRLLYATMRAHEFIVIDCEWWHFELGTRRWAALTGQPVWYGAADIILDEPAFTNSYRLIRLAARAAAAH